MLARVSSKWGKTRLALTEYYRVGSMEDYDQVLRAVGHFTHRYGKIDLIDSFNEHWLDLEARIRTDFNMFGMRTDTIDTVKRKSKMKDRFREAGIPVARGAVVRDLDAARELVKDTGYPVVAKPDRGVGALHTYKIANDAELTEFFRSQPDVDYIIEEFIDGDIMSFDGLTDRDGKIVFCTGHAYMSGIMETVNAKLRDRACRIVMTLTGTTYDQAYERLVRAKWNVKGALK